MNPCWQTITGFDEKEVIGRLFGDLLPGDGAGRFQTMLEQLRRDGEMHHAEFEMIRRDGQAITVAVDGNVIPGENGTCNLCQFTLADITAKYDDTTRRVLEFDGMHAIFDAIPYGLMIAGSGDKILMINKTGVSLMGYDKPGELTGTSVTARIRATGTDVHNLTGNGSVVRDSEGILFHRSGREIPILNISIPVMFGSTPAVLETFMDISEQQKRTGELSESKRQFATLLDNLPGMVYRCRNDRNWTMEFISDGCIELTGYSPADIILNKSITYNDLIVAEDQERVWEEVQIGQHANKPFIVEYRIKCADGKIKWVWEKGKYINPPDGSNSFIEGFISDISEYKHAEQIQNVLLEISKASYTSGNLDEVFRLIHKSLGMIIDVENFYLAMYDEGSDTITLPFQVDSNDTFTAFPAGKTLTAYVIKTRTPLLASQQDTEKLVASGAIEIVGTMSKVWLGAPLQVGNKVIGVIAIQSYTNPEQYDLHDLELLSFVADHIATTIFKKGAEESFQKEKAYLDQLFEGSPEGIIMTTELGKIVRVNTAFLKLFGYTPSDVLDRTVDDLIADPGNRAESTKITTDIPKGITTETETHRNHKDGHLIDVSILATPITINNQVVGGYCIYRDISEHKRIEQSLIAARDKAEGSDRLKSAFLANMSHEIRTPMNAILGFSSLLSEPELTRDEQQEFIEIIRERGNDLMRIIDDIIDIAKIESGQIKIEIKDCLLNSLMSNLVVTLNEVKRKTNKTKVALNCIPGNEDPDFTILTDGNRLRQVLTNLIENGLKFTDQGHVEFGYIQKNIGTIPYLEFYVCDTGIGIPREMHNIIFERFRQVDDTATRKYGGAGLGLTISRNLVQLLGGTIRVESERGKGTSFYILLPLYQNTSRFIEPYGQVHVPMKVQDWSRKNILVVEDEDSNYLLMERMLKNTGAKLVWVKNGMEAIAICKLRDFDLVLMDIRMPVMDGYETTQILKKEHPNLPVIAQTAYALKGEREKSIAAGCDNYISKPIKAHELMSVLEKHLNSQN